MKDKLRPAIRAIETRLFTNSPNWPELSEARVVRGKYFVEVKLETIINLEGKNALVNELIKESIDSVEVESLNYRQDLEEYE